MKTLLALTILSGVLVAPAFAQMSSEDMSCADFTAMDSSGQMAAMDSMGSGMESDAMASDSMKSDDMKSDDMASDDVTVTAESVAEACGEHPDMMVHDAIEQAKMAH